MKLLLLIVLGVVTLQLSLSVAIGRTFYTKPVMIKASVEDNTPANFIIVSLSKSLKVLGKGVELTWTKYKDYNRIRKIKRKQGSSSISFTEFKLLQSAKEDLSKAFRMLVMLPLSPEFFIYSYLLGPIISTAKSPWAWAAYPSTFDDTDDKAIRDRVVSGRRTQAAVFGLYTLQSVMIDELDASRKAQREAEFKMVEKALKAKSPEEGMKVLQPWFATYRRKNEATDKLDLTKVPGGIVKQFLRGLGSDGVPNIPLVRRLNNAEVKKYIDTVRNGDEFLQQKGIKHLSNEELKKACIERGIRVEKRSSGELSNELNTWLRIVNSPVKESEYHSIVPRPEPNQMRPRQQFATNFQAKRLALMSLNIAKGVKFTKIGENYKSIL